TLEQLKAHQELRTEQRKAGQRLADSLAAPQRVIVVSSPAATTAKPATATPTELALTLAAQIDSELAALIESAAAETLMGLSEDELRLLMGKKEHRPKEREVQRFAFRKFGDWRRDSLKPKDVIAAAGKDEKFKRAVPSFGGYSTFLRGLKRKD